MAVPKRRRLCSKSGKLFYSCYLKRPRYITFNKNYNFFKKISSWNYRLNAFLTHLRLDKQSLATPYTLSITAQKYIENRFLKKRIYVVKYLRNKFAPAKEALLNLKVSGVVMGNEILSGDITSLNSGLITPHRVANYCKLNKSLYFNLVYSGALYIKNYNLNLYVTYVHTLSIFLPNNYTSSNDNLKMTNNALYSLCPSILPWYNCTLPYKYVPPIIYQRFSLKKSLNFKFQLKLRYTFINLV